jgi:uncharacterized protein (DUF302 family)
MFRLISLTLLTLLTSSAISANESLSTKESAYSVKQTADKFESLIKDKGLTLFARINHQKNAEKAKLTLGASEVIIFGNPKIGTPLMNCAPSVAIDLPQKVLIREDTNHKVWLSYNKPAYLKERHKIEGCDKLLNKISNVLDKLSSAATR